jgi:Holliday junction resolvasome RuvABC endonuclease subunit
MVILALDQATTTGYAVVEDTGRVLTSGVCKLADPKRTGESRGMRYIRFRRFLQDTLSTCFDCGNIEMICHEQTLLRGGAATEIANGLKALILEAAAESGVEVSCVHTTELKHFATGNGRAEKSDMINACFKLSGVSPRDDNEADAILIGLWASSRYGTFPAPQWGNKKAPKRRKSKRGESWLDDLV